MAYLFLRVVVLGDAVVTAFPSSLPVRVNAMEQILGYERLAQPDAAAHADFSP